MSLINGGDLVADLRKGVQCRAGVLHYHRDLSASKGFALLRVKRYNIPALEPDLPADDLSLIAEETDVTSVVDALGGSRAIEELADRIESEVVRWMDAIEERGGMLGCLRSGWIEREIEEIAWRSSGPPVGAGTPLTDLERDLLRPEPRSGRQAQPVTAPLRGRCSPSALKEVAVAATQHQNIIPPLIKAYLRLGGFVGDGAYLDRDFNSIDVCVVMDTTRKTELYLHFYQRTRGRRG